MTHAQDRWWPTEVNVYDPACTSGDPECWNDPQNQPEHLSSIDYVPLDPSQVKNKHHICVSFPHLKDSYWVGVAYGIIEEGKRLGQKITLVEAGGYTKLERQLSQVDDCISNGAEGLIIGSVSAIGNAKQIDLLRESGVPVVDVINGINTAVDAKSLQSFYNMGFISCQWVVDQAQGQAAVRIAWFPGPPGAGWSVAADKGCVDAVADSNIEIVFTRWGDTGKSVQLKLVEDVLTSSLTGDNVDLDYIIGTATTAEAAAGAIRALGLRGKIDIVAFYYTPGIHAFLKRGEVAMAPTDQMIVQARIAVDQMVRLLEGIKMSSGGRAEFGNSGRLAEHVQPPPIVVTPDTVDAFDTSTTLAPRGWRPLFSVD
jgi:periplasmic protein TorT